MACVESIHETIQQIYRAAIAPDEWPATVEAIAGMVGTHRGMLLADEPTACGLIATAGIDPEHAQGLRREFQARPPDWISAIPVGAVRRQTSMISDADFRRSELYNTAVRPARGFYGMVVPLVRTPTQQSYFVAGRDQGVPDFTDQDGRVLSLLIPHLVTALEVRGHLAASDLRTFWAYEAFGDLNVGVIHLDADRRPVFVNARAETIAAARDGLLLRAREVSASCAADARTLEALLAKAVAFNSDSRGASQSSIVGPQMRCHLSRLPPSPPLVVTVVPVHPRVLVAGSGRVSAILFVAEPGRAAGFDPPSFASAFQLTARESQLAALLASGVALCEAASEMGIGIGTARGYLKQVLAKTGTHRQAELVALLLSGGTLAGR